MESLTAEENAEVEGWGSFLEELAERHAHPLNINSATREDLERLPFLSGEQTEAVLAHIYRYGPLKTMDELVLIRELDYESRRFLCLFFYAGEVEKEKEELRWKTLLRSGKNTVITRMEIPLYQRDGYRSHSDEELLKNPNKKYLGNALYHSWRYQYAFGNKIFWGLVAEKDAGEPFGSYGNWSYDFFSFHVFCRDVRPWLKTVALGDYRLAFGEGLVLNNGFPFGRDGTFASSPAQGIRRYASTSEADFFRGTAATFRWGNVDISAFYSHRKLDATPIGEDSVSSLRTDGLHRTLSELERKHNVTAQLAGGNVTWRCGNYRLGVTSCYLHTDKCFAPGNALYRAYYPHGNRFFTSGAHYGYSGYHLSFSGETAYSDNRGGWATLNRATYRVNARYRLTLLQRFYSYRYYSFHGAAFGEESRVQNESGVYAGLEASPLDYLQLMAYADFFHSPWPRYTMTHSSSGQKGMIQLRYACRRNVNVVLRYRVRHKEKSDIYFYDHWLKGQLNVSVPQQWDMQTSALFHGRTNADTRERSNGFAFVQTVKKSWAKDIVRFSALLAYFRTDDYDSRLYFYEPGLLYTFYYPAYYGRGLRAAVTLRGSWNGLTLMGKYGLTHYFDRDAIGSGTQRIDSSSKNDISLQLKYDF